ncbi:MAG: AsnC family transcriptional regulator [Methanocellales archaeon]|nr:AsnC family transcriptional regulator [Methanocellales archaeon]
MDETDRKLLEMTHDGIPLVKRPFAEIAGSLGIAEDEILQRLRRLLDEGVIRRFGASIAHRKIGIAANAMCVWNVPDERVDEVGDIIASFGEVTHCYIRSRARDWRYNMFAMVHGRTRQECEKVADRITKAVGIRDRKILFSEREFKKTGVRIE